MSIWYASNLGGGTGVIQASPRRLGLLWPLVSAGDTIFLLNDVYQGADSMINPTPGLSGTSSAPITIEAINDGGAWIDGEGVRTPVLLQQNDYFILKGFNFYDSNQAAAYIYQSYRVKLQRLCGWDAAAGNNHVFSGDQSHYLLYEDCGGWGRGRKIFEIFSANAGTMRRCWGRFQNAASTSGGETFECSYSASGTTLENCIGTWAETAAQSGPGSIFRWGGASSGNDNSKMFGCIGYIRGSDSVSAVAVVGSTGGGGYVDVDGENVAAYVQPGSYTSIPPFGMNNVTSGASLNKITSIGGAADVFGNWAVTNHVDSGTTVTIFSGSGAVIGYRYVDRVLTSTPLWPWPMDERIKAAMTFSGYQSVTLGFSNDTGRVTDAIEQMFGVSVPPEFEGDPPEEDTELPQTDAPPPSPEVVGSTATGKEWHTLCKIFLDTGTKYYSKKDVQHPDYLYEGRIKSFGFIDRSIPVPSGIPQQGDCHIVVIDTDRELRDILAHQTPRRRFIELRNVPEGGSESVYPPLATFEIYDFQLQDGCVEIFGRDINFSWLDREIPGLINRTNFPDLMENVDEAFMPIIAGVLDAPSQASPPNPQGVLTLPRMTLRRWGLAQHPILYVELCGRIDPSDEFTLIDPGDYTITEEPHTFDGVPYTLTFVDFNVDQDLALEVRCRIVEGFYTRGAFGTMPAVINSPLTALRNPVDTFINVIYGTLYTERRIPSFNTDSFLYVHSLFETIIQSSPVAPYACDGCIDRPKTIREFLDEWVTSFEVDLYVNRYGEIEMNVTTEEDPERPVFSQGPVYGEPTDQSLILYNSVRQSGANPTCNRLRYNYGYNYATDEFLYKGVYDNETDQTALGGADSPPIPFVEEAPTPVTFYWVRESATADDVVRRRMEYLALGSYRIEVKLPMPQVFNDIELAKLVGITSVWGLDVGGYQNREVKTTNLTYDLDQKIVTLKAIVRVPNAMGDENPNCPGLTGTSILHFGDLEYFDDGTNQVSPLQFTFDPDDFPGLTSVRFKVKIVVEDLVYETQPVFSIVDENGTSYFTSSLDWFLDYVANADDTYFYEAIIDETITLNTNTAHTYKLKWSKVSAAGGGFHLMNPEVWVFFDASDQAKFQMPLMRGLFLDGVGLYRDNNTIGTLNTYALMTGQTNAASGKISSDVEEIDYYEIYIIADKDTGAGKIAVKDITTSTVLTDTVIDIAAGDHSTYAVYTLQLAPSVFTPGNEWAFVGQHSNSVGFYTLIKIVAGDINFKVGSPASGYFTSPSLCAISTSLSTRTGVDECEQTYKHRGYIHVAADWPDNTVFYFEATSAGFVTLLDTGTIASPASPATIVATLTHGVTITYQRSGSISLTDGHVYAVGRSGVSPTTVPTTDVTGFIVGVFSGP